MSKWDGEFNGTYDTSRYAGGSLEDHIMNAGCGIYEGPNGELIRESDSRIDVWGRGDGRGNYDHYYIEALSVLNTLCNIVKSVLSIAVPFTVTSSSKRTKKASRLLQQRLADSQSFICIMG